MAIFATLIILAYTVFAANQNAIDNSQACAHASDNGIDHASDNSVLKSCCPPPLIPAVGGTCPDGYNQFLDTGCCKQNGG